MMLETAPNTQSLGNNRKKYFEITYFTQCIIKYLHPYICMNKKYIKICILNTGRKKFILQIPIRHNVYNIQIEIRVFFQGLY